MKLRYVILTAGLCYAIVQVGTRQCVSRESVPADTTQTRAASTHLNNSSEDHAQTDLTRVGAPLKPKGESVVQGFFTLDEAVKRDGRYRVRLSDGRVATLTLDIAAQRVAESVLTRARARRGAIVVMDMNGRVIALAGKKGRKQQFDMATTVWAPAASVFKIVTAAALLQAGVTSDQRVCYHGGTKNLELHHVRDDPVRDRQCRDLSYAIGQSQNAIIGKLALQHLQPDDVRATIRRFELAKTPAFALATEPGRFDIPDGELEFAQVAAGFWHTELSPLGGVRLAHIVASGGMSFSPRIIDYLTDPSRAGDERMTIPVDKPRRVLAQALASDLTEMLVTTTASGTAFDGFHDRKRRPFLRGIRVAGKTGTLTRRSPSYLQYSWFVGFAPADKPQVAIAVLLGNPRKWHLKAYTAARLVLQDVVAKTH